LTGSQWFNETYYLSAESSHVEGKATLYYWQEEIIDRMVDSIHREVAVRKSARVGATKMIDGAVGFSIDQDPSTIMVVQPTENDSFRYSETEIEPMIRDNPHIQESINARRIAGRKKREKTAIKFFKGGYLSMVGSETPRNFRMVTVRRVFVDEFDACADEVGKDGSLVAIVRKRTADFFNGKNCWFSTPLIEGGSQIDKMYKVGSQAVRLLSCIHCDNLFELDFFEQFSWELDDDNELIKDSVHIECPHCREKLYHSNLEAMDKIGEWAHAFQKREKDISSYYIWAGYSYHFPWWKVVSEFIKAEKDRSLMQGFYNLVLGLPFSEDFDSIGHELLLEKKEHYEEEVPDGVIVLTMGVDTQDNRLEWLVKGYGKNKESWDIAKGQIDGDPQFQETWDKLLEITRKTYQTRRGVMKPYYVFIDRGGNKTEYVDEFCKNKSHLGIYPIIGANTLNAPILDYRKPKNDKDVKYQTPFYLLGVNKIKDTTYYHTINQVQGEAYTHFPDYETWDEAYMKQLLAEEKNDKGRWELKKGTKRNEAVDLQGYCYAGYRLVLNSHNIDKMADQGKWISGVRNVIRKKPRRNKSNQVDIYS